MKKEALLKNNIFLMIWKVASTLKAKILKTKENGPREPSL